ncbi:MAG: aromatic-ring-hydroxylating dioxygenase subunit beta [Sphingomonas sp.]
MSVEAGSALILHEAHCLDRHLWDEWLALYAEDAVFWMPAWKNEAEPTDDPDSELSLIYHQGRARLAERVWRVRSGKSPASVPLVRTMHAITNIQLAAPPEPDLLRLRSNWTAHHYDPKRKAQHLLFGFYEHDLRSTGAGWSIARKKIVLLNDRIPSVTDFYSV